MPEAALCDFIESTDGAKLVTPELAALVRWAERVEVVNSLTQFCSHYASTFVSDDGEHTHQQYAIFRIFEDKFASSIENFVRWELEVQNPITFFERVRDKCGPSEDAVLRAILACLDFETFAAEMRAHERINELAAESVADMGL